MAIGLTKIVDCKSHSDVSRLEEKAKKKMVLTDGERAEMHAAVLEYLDQRCGSAAVENVARLLATSPLVAIESETALERRWATLVRLANRNRELESKLKCTEPGRSSASCSQNGRTLCSSPTATLTGHRDTLTSVVFSNVDPLLFSGSEDGSVRVWDSDQFSLVRVLRGHVGNVACICVEPRREQLLASCSDDCTARVIDIATFEVKASLIGDEALCSCCWLGDDEMSLLTGSRNGELRVWNVSQASVRWSLRIRSAILCIAVPNQSNCSLFAFGGKDEQIHVCDPQQKKEIQILHVHDNAVTCLSFCTQQMENLVCESMGGNSLRVKTETGNSNAFSPRFLVSGSRDKSVVLFDLTAATMLFRFTDHQNWVRGLTCTPDGTMIISVSDDGCCNVYDLSTRRRLKSINAHDHFVTCVNVRRAGSQLATGSADTSVRIWRFSE